MVRKEAYLDCGMPGLNGTSETERNWTGEPMSRKRYTPEQVANLLRQIEVAVANGKTTDQASREAGIVEHTYYR